VLLALFEFRALGHRGARSTYREPFISRNIFTSPARRVHGGSIIEIQRWSGKYTLVPRARGNKWLTLATSGRWRRKEKKKETEFKHIRERRCLKNNHGARKGKGRRGARRREQEQRGSSGSTTGAINSSLSLAMVVGIGLAVTTLVLQRRQQPRRCCDIESRINYPHAKTYYRVIDKTDAPQLGLARSRVLRMYRHKDYMKFYFSVGVRNDRGSIEIGSSLSGGRLRDLIRKCIYIARQRNRGGGVAT